MAGNPSWKSEIKAFSMTPDPAFFYLSSCHRVAVARLQEGVQRGQGLMVLEGMPGLGKTTLLHALVQRLGKRALPVFLHSDTLETGAGVFRAICSQLSVSRSGDTVEEMTQALRRFAARKGTRRKKVLILLDEADEISEEIRQPVLQLHGMEKERKKLFHLILAGSPGLGTRMAGTSPPAPAGSVLRPMTSGEAIEYILHRLLVAGIRPEQAFDTDALRWIVHGSGGIPRMINVICGNAMDISRGMKMRTVDERSAREALQDLNPGSEGERPAETRVQIKTLFEDALLHLSRNPPKRKPVPIKKTARPPRPDAKKRSLFQGSGKRSLPFPGKTSLPGNGSRDGKSPARASPVGDAGRFLLFFLLVTALLGGGSLFQVVQRNREIREAKKQQTEQLLGSPEEQVNRKAPFPARPTGPDLTPGTQDPLSRYMEQKKRRIQEEIETFGKAPASPGAHQGVSFQDRDLAGIALDRYRRLDRDLLKEFARLNPHIRNWNALDRTVNLSLPESAARSSGDRATVDIDSLFLASYETRKQASAVVEKLHKAGLQNLFVRTEGGAPGTRLQFDLCAGVFGSREAAAEYLRMAKKMGFTDARPIRIREPFLARVLQPFRPPDP